MKKIILVLIMLVSLSSTKCNKSSLFEELIPLTNDGRNSLGAMVNGEIWRNIKTLGRSNDDLGIGFGNNTIGNHREICIFINVLKEDYIDEFGNVKLNEKIYSHPTVPESQIFSTERTDMMAHGSKIGYYSDTITGWVIFRTYKKYEPKSDTDNKKGWILSGEFEFDGYSSRLDSTVTVRDGRFDLLFNDSIE